MKFVPTTISRKVASQALLAKKHSPTILFGAGVASMVGSTVLACRATLKLETTLDKIENEKKNHDNAKHAADSGDTDQSYPDREYKRDIAIISVRGVGRIAKLYAPSIILGGVGVVCLTKSHQILKERNTALAAAYVAVDKAFGAYRERVVARYGDEVDRELRHGSEQTDLIDEETGESRTVTAVAPGEPSGYARYFDSENRNWNNPPFERHNWLFLRTQQNWANDMLHARGHLFLNEVYSMLGLSHTSAGSVVGWVYKRENDRGDNYVDFGCWDQEERPLDFANGMDGSILLDFNVDGLVWDQIDDSVARNS